MLESAGICKSGSGLKIADHFCVEVAYKYQVQYSNNIYINLIEEKMTLIWKADWLK